MLGEELAELLRRRHHLERRRPTGALHGRIADAAEAVQAGLEVAATLPHRERLLQINHRFAGRLLDLESQWLAEAEQALADAAEQALADAAADTVAP